MYLYIYSKKKKKCEKKIIDNINLEYFFFLYMHGDTELLSFILDTALNSQNKLNCVR